MKHFFNSLYFQIALILVIIFGGLAFFLMRNSFKISEEYHNEITQNLNKDVSKYLVEEVKGLYDGQEVNLEQVGVMMHHVMATNPSTEVYILNTNGEILKHVAMNKTVQAKSVSIEPIETFIEKNGDIYIKGDDPKEIGGKKIFSAAPYYHEGQKVGYIYTIVGGRDYDDLVATYKSGYIRNHSLKNIAFSSLVALGLGLLLMYLLTRNFNKLCMAFMRFKDGDLNARIENVTRGEFGVIADTYNKMADTIQENIEELRGVDNLRKELIANISHDLRTPIASIQGYAETLLLKKEHLSEEEQVKYLGVVMKNSKKLKKLVDDLFELSKLEAKQRELNPEALQMAELVQDVTDKYRIIAKEKGISFNTIYSKNLPLVSADLALIDRALQNIIDNAIKFCETGDVITLELSLNGDSIRTKVSDTGAGIEAEELPHIFERYRKGKILTDTQKGSGLGLAIVKKIMELHHTDVYVESQIKKGTTFFFDLPLGERAIA